MRRTIEHSSPLFSRKKIDTGATKDHNALTTGLFDSEQIQLVEEKEKSERVECGEFSQNLSLKQETNSLKETEEGLNYSLCFQESKFKSNLKQHLYGENEESTHSNSQKSVCVEEESMTISEVIEEKHAKAVLRNVNSETSGNDNSPGVKTDVCLKCCENGGQKKSKVNAKDFLNRKQLKNIQLPKIIFPKNAAMVLNELKKGCTYRTKERGQCPRIVVVTVEHEDGLMAVGEGQTKVEAKNIAAENAIKKIFLDLIWQKRTSRLDDEIDMKYEEFLVNLPWKELTSLAMHKMFLEWQNQGVEFPEMFLSKLKVPLTSIKDSSLGENRHPCAILNMFLPGVAPVELERQEIPHFHVTMGYLVEGKMYSATGSTKKEAKKKAAMTVLKSLYGLEFPSYHV